MPGGVKAELDVFVSKAGLRLVKTDGKVLGAFPLQRIQQWGIPTPGRAIHTPDTSFPFCSSFLTSA